MKEETQKEKKEYIDVELVKALMKAKGYRRKDYGKQNESYPADN